MNRTPAAAVRCLPDGAVLQNRLLAALPGRDYARILKRLQMIAIPVGEIIQTPGIPITAVYFPNGGVFSVTTEMHDGTLVEAATVGVEGMLGIGVFLGDRLGSGRTFQQVPDGLLPAMAVDAFIKESARAGPFRERLLLYAQASLLQIMQCTACNALHDIKQRCSRWLLQTHDRVGAEEFALKHEFLAIMLGVHRPTVTLAVDALQRAGVITSRYGRIRVRTRRGLEAASCECYATIKGHFTRLGL
jgi:CRP-like cAMP-binding protein